jgi:hypothetical protein
MMKTMTLTVFLVLAGTLSAQAPDQQVSQGPRVGLVYVFNMKDGGPLEVDDIWTGGTREVFPLTTAVGYHVDYEVQSGSEIKPVIQTNTLILGLEQDLMFPLWTVVAGVRHGEQGESGVGATISGKGTGIAFALGYNFKSGDVVYPVNLAFSKSGDIGRLALITGFNMPK